MSISSIPYVIIQKALVVILCALYQHASETCPLSLHVPFGAPHKHANKLFSYIRPRLGLTLMLKISNVSLFVTALVESLLGEVVHLIYRAFMAATFYIQTRPEDGQEPRLLCRFSDLHSRAFWAMSKVAFFYGELGKFPNNKRLAVLTYTSHVWTEFCREISLQVFDRGSISKTITNCFRIMVYHSEIFIKLNSLIDFAAVIGYYSQFSETDCDRL